MPPTHRDESPSSQRATDYGAKAAALYRHRFDDLWADLPHLVVLATLPRYGRTTWMKQVSLTHPHRRTLWIRGDDALRSFDPTGGVDADVIIIDDAVTGADDPGWDTIAQLLDAHPRLTVIVSAWEGPPASWSRDVHMVVLDERDLAYTDDEVRSVVELRVGSAPPDVVHDLVSSTRGHPALVAERLALLQEHDLAAHRIFPDARADASYARTLAAAPPHHPLIELLRRGSRFRMFSAALVGAHPAGGLWARLTAVPTGRMSVDDMTGDEIFTWTPTVWSEIISHTTAERAEHLREVADALATTGTSDTRLYHLLEQRDYAGAERLVDHDIRLFHSTRHPATESALLEVPLDALTGYPNLLLLAADTVRHRTKSQAPAQPYYEAARPALTIPDEAGVFERFRSVCRLLVVATELGDRAGGTRLLDHSMELLGDSSSGLLALARRDASLADRLSEELQFVYAPATQLDRHDVAIEVCRVLNSLVVPGSRFERATMLTSATELFLAGFSSLRDTPAMGHVDSLEALEDGEDDRAAYLLRALTDRPIALATASTAEAYVTVVRTLISAELLRAADLDDAVARSAAFWTDGQASTFITAASAIGHLALGNRERAAELVRTHHGDDWFLLFARGVVSLMSDDPGAALGWLDEATKRSSAPRARTLSGVVIAAAEARLGRDEASVATLISVWRGTAPGLVRFALRFVDTEDVAWFLDRADLFPSALERLLTEARADHRPLTRKRAPKLTPIERELLLHLRQGQTLTVIASERFVSLNTVRTQLRMLYRKLGVNSREEAVAIAGQLGVYAAG